MATFLIPLGTGLLIARMFGLSWNASVLTGSLLASHTLLTLPILTRLFVKRLRQEDRLTGA